MKFLAKHGEKVLLAVLVTGLLVSVIFGLMSLQGLDHPRTLKLTPPAANVELDVEQLDATLARLQGNPPVLAVETGAFTPETRVVCINSTCQALIPSDLDTCPYCGSDTTVKDIDSDGGGLLDSVELKLGLNPNDAADELQDLDGDGFPTLFEVEQGTDPADSASRPDLIGFVRLLDIIETGIVFELRGTARFSESWTLQLYWKYPDEDRGKTDFIKTGRRFGRNNEFVVESFTEKTSLVDGKNIDQSVAVIRSAQGEVKLGRNQDNRRGAITEISAVIGTIFGPEWQQEVNLNDTIEIDSKSYMIVDIQRDAVVVQQDVESDPLPDPIVIVEPSTEDEQNLNKYKSLAPDTGADIPGTESPAPMNLEDLF